MRVPVAAALLVALLLAAIAAPSSGGAAAGGGAPVASPDGSRVVSARAYQGGKWMLPGETPESVGAALAQLEPTYVDSLIRFKAGEKVTKREVNDWNTIRTAVLAASPNAEFAIELNGLEYPTVKKLNAMMAKVRARFANDGWMFDFYTPAAKKRPKVMKAAVANAHGNGEWIGGNAFGIDKKPKIPAGTDFLAVQDYAFKIDLDAVKRLAARVPALFFHLGNSPGFPGSDGCVFIEKLSTAKRQAYITRRAGQQGEYNFRFQYPVFFPECARNRGQPNVKIFAYNAIKDAPMIDTIGGLMGRFE